MASQPGTGSPLRARSPMQLSCGTCGCECFFGDRTHGMAINHVHSSDVPARAANGPAACYAVLHCAAPPAFCSQLQLKPPLTLLLMQLGRLAGLPLRLHSAGFPAAVQGLHVRGGSLPGLAWWFWRCMRLCLACCHPPPPSACAMPRFFILPSNALMASS